MKTSPDEGFQKRADRLERPSFIERLVLLIPVPYAAGRLLLTGVLGPAGGILFKYLDTSELHASVQAFFYDMKLEAAWQAVSTIVLYSLLPFYVLLIIRSIRLKVLEAERGLAPLLQAGEERCVAAFSRVAKPLSSLLLTATLVVLLLSDILKGFGEVPGPFGRVSHLSTSLFSYTVYGTATWTYCLSISLTISSETARHRLEEISIWPFETKLIGKPSAVQ